MIPEIGLIIACYTLVRYTSIITTKTEHPVAKGLATLAILVTIVLAWALVTTQSPSGP